MQLACRWRSIPPVSSARFAIMMAKRGLCFPSTKPLNSAFMCITRKRLGWQFLQRLFYESFLRRITSITQQDSPQDASSLLARSMWLCGVRDWSATRVLSLYWITARALAHERGQPPCRCAMAARFRRLSTRVDCGGHHQYLANRRLDQWTWQGAYGQPSGGDDSEQQLPWEFCPDPGESSVCSSSGRAAAPAPLLVRARHG